MQIIAYLFILQRQYGRQLSTAQKSGLSLSYRYNASGIRTEKTVNGVTTEYYLDGSSIVAEKTGTDVIWYLYDGMGLAGFELNGTSYYYVYNGQGDVIGILDSSGNRVVTYTYDSWGSPLSVTGSLASTVGQKNPIRYRGYYYDTETGLYYLQSRYYDPVVGRFLNADGLLGANGDLMSYNLYAYCSNNPVNLSDPTGMCPYNGTIADFHRAEQGLPSIDCICSKPSPFKNKDGSYSLYDNKRHDPDNIFHEQILSGKASKPSWDMKNHNYGIGSISGTVYTGGWEWEHVNLSLLDFGTAKASAQYKDKEVKHWSNGECMDSVAFC